MTADRRAALIEAMARAMEKADSHAYEYQQTSSWEHLAEAALDLALEEAAKVVEFSPDSHTAREMQLMIDKAAAIRALKGGA